MEIPFKLIRTVDGRVKSGKSNELVELKLSDGSVKKIYSGYEGYWSTRIRESLVPAATSEKAAVPTAPVASAIAASSITKIATAPNTSRVVEVQEAADVSEQLNETHEFASEPEISMTSYSIELD